jgi:hypothetical protein
MDTKSKVERTERENPLLVALQRELAPYADLFTIDFDTLSTDERLDALMRLEQAQALLDGAKQLVLAELARRNQSVHPVVE